MAKAAVKYKAVFLDRDGVITENDQSSERGAFYITCARHLEYRQGALEAIAALCHIYINHNGTPLLVFVVTSQKWASLGLPPAAKDSAERQLQKINMQFHKDVIDADGYIVTVLYLIEQGSNKADGIKSLAEQYDIDLAESWMVGDSASDVEAGTANGCKTIYIANEYAQSDNPGADHECPSLLEAKEIIGEYYNRARRPVQIA